MENRFDDLTKALAEGLPRRQALRRLATLFGGALLGSLAFGAVARAHPPKSQLNCCTYWPGGHGCGGIGGGPYTICVQGRCPEPGKCTSLTSYAASSCSQGGL